MLSAALGSFLCAKSVGNPTLVSGTAGIRGDRRPLSREIGPPLTGIRAAYRRDHAQRTQGAGVAACAAHERDLFDRRALACAGPENPVTASNQP
jgi:hypothetical protein